MNGATPASARSAGVCFVIGVRAANFFTDPRPSAPGATMTAPKLIKVIVLTTLVIGGLIVCPGKIQKVLPTLGVLGIRGHGAAFVGCLSPAPDFCFFLLPLVGHQAGAFFTPANLGDNNEAGILHLPQSTFGKSGRTTFIVHIASRLPGSPLQSAHPTTRRAWRGLLHGIADVKQGAQ